jgi:uncharacterized protein (TIGR00304 family)
MMQYLTILGISLVVAGLTLALISAAILLHKTKFKGSGGAVILIGPIPIVIGSDRRITLILLALTLLLIVIFFLGIYGSGL